MLFFVALKYIRQIINILFHQQQIELLLQYCRLVYFLISEVLFYIPMSHQLMARPTMMNWVLVGTATSRRFVGFVRHKNCRLQYKVSGCLLS